MGQNREETLSKFVLLLMVTRHAWIYHLNNAPPEVRPQTPNAFSILEVHAPDNPLQRGSVVNLAAISEECPFDADKMGLEHYTVAEFVDVTGYAVSHELFHLLCGADHNTSANTVFGKGPHLSTLTTPANEMTQINLKARRGVTP